MRYLTGMMIVATSLALVGCGKYHGKYGGKYYQQDAQLEHPIVVPRGVGSPVTQQFFKVPNQHLAQAKPHLSLLPPDPTFLAYLDTYKHKKK